MFLSNSDQVNFYIFFSVSSVNICTISYSTTCLHGTVQVLSKGNFFFGIRLILSVFNLNFCLDCTVLGPMHEKYSSIVLNCRVE